MLFHVGLPANRGGGGECTQLFQSPAGDKPSVLVHPNHNADLALHSQGHRLEFDSLLCAFARATECVLVMGNPTLSERGESDFQVLRETFHFEVMQVARSKRVQVGGNEGADNVAAARAMLGEERLMELQAYYDQLCMAGPDDESIVPEFVRQAFVLPQKKADQLMTFFDSNKDGMVSLDEFIHGMTLLYGELGNLYQQLKTKAPGTPLMSPMGGPPQGAPHPSPLMSPRLAFDGPVPMMATQHEEMADIVI